MLDLTNIIKALLLSNDGQMLSMDDFKRALSDVDEKNILKVINEIVEAGGDTFDIIEIKGQYYARTKQEYAEYIQRLKGLKPEPKQRRALIETLAVIAMRQPISRVEIEDLRCVQLNISILHDLQDYGWVKVVKVTSNDTHLYGTTLNFLQDFNISSINELESMHIKDVFNESV
jgi:segregation and condensation protein B